jgi:hypothetical protein
MSEEGQIEGWVEEMRSKMRADYNGLTDAGDRMEYLEYAARTLGVPKSNVLLFLRSTGPVNVKEPQP